MELVGGHTDVQKAWQTWLFVDFGHRMSGQDGRPERGGEATDCASVGGVWRNSGGRFSACEGSCRW